MDCSIAPNRELLLPIVARAHFGNGDKSKWGYLGSRKAIYDDYSSGMTLSALSRAFGITQAAVRTYIIEYKLYLEALKFSWTKTEHEILLNPGVEFNPPVRFLQTSGHKETLGLTYDTANMAIIFKDPEAKDRFRHLILKLVISPARGLGATVSYRDVFADFQPPKDSSKSQQAQGKTPTPSSHEAHPSADEHLDDDGSTPKGEGSKPNNTTKPKINSLFSYSPKKIHSGLLSQLMREAARINCQNLPAAATFLLRSVVETVLKEIIKQNNANPNGNTLNLENCLDLCANQKVKLTPNDKKILKEFRKSSLDYLNLGAHGEIVPNCQRLFSARDTIDQFIKDQI